jgi:hypothetical protein
MKAGGLKIAADTAKPFSGSRLPRWVHRNGTHAPSASSMGKRYGRGLPPVDYLDNLISY